MNKFEKLLATDKILLLDGAMGTLLYDKGLDRGNAPETVCLDHPEWLTEIAESYAAAGSNIVQTNTFGGSKLRLQEFGLASELIKINQTAVLAAKAGVSDDVLVSASMGPCGKMLVPFGDTSPETIQESFREQAEALVQADADMICIETMTDVQEALLAVKAIRQTDQSIPIIATITFNHTPSGFFTIMGNSISDSAGLLAEAGVSAIGSNCGNGLDHMLNICAEFRKHSDLPIQIQANAGIPVVEESNLIYPETPELFASKMGNLIEAGARIIGGCCGTTPDHIRKMRKSIDEWQISN